MSWNQIKAQVFFGEKSENLRHQADELKMKKMHGLVDNYIRMAELLEDCTYKCQTKESLLDFLKSKNWDYANEFVRMVESGKFD